VTFVAGAHATKVTIPDRFAPIVID
jgi:hypothetical protein